MRQCPKCRKWTLDFDNYFGRFRCLNPDCAWMPPSTAEREIRLLQSHTQPVRLESVEITQLGLTLTPSYDQENDAFSVDFGLSEPTFELPEPDGSLIWRVTRRSETVAGFTMLGVREGCISRISVEFILRRKQGIERRLRSIPEFVSKGRATKDLVEEVVVTAVSDESPFPCADIHAEKAWNDVVKKVQAMTVS